MRAQASAAPEVKPAKSRGLPPINARQLGVQSEGSACSGSPQRELCLQTASSDRLLMEFAPVILCQRRLRLGQALYRSGEVFEAVYLVRTGFVKSVVLLEDGREQITGLNMPGEMLGMDGLASGRYASDAIALGDGEVCVVPYHRLENLGREARSMQRKLHRMFSHEIVREQRMMLMLGSMGAEERVANFLLNLSDRFSALGYSPSEFILRMTRDEIGSLLGMKLETVSRIFSKFQKKVLIEVERQHVRIVSIEGLRGVVRGELTGIKARRI
jgi:CRP/FNR family transcriptional regulator, anaerobic regulatory protein